MGLNILATIMYILSDLSLKYLSMKKAALIILACIPLISLSQEISSSRFMNDIRYLSSDELAGRWPGTSGDSLTLLYIKSEFEKAGLKPMGDSYFQYFSIVTGTKPGANNSFEYKNQKFIPGTDYIPVSFTLDTTVTAGLCYAGYGAESSQYSDYNKNDIKDKWVIVNYDIPDDIIKVVKNAVTVRARARNAEKKGAAGVIFVYSGKKDFPEVFLEKPSSVLSIPVIAVKENVLSNILSQEDFSIITAKYDLKNKPKQIKGNYQLTVKTDIEKVEVKTANVTGYIEGTDPVLKNEYVIIGGHHDHLGMGGPGTNSRKPEKKDVHHGADDNASGTAGVIELARWYGKNPQRRSLIFSAFAAEEQGLIGSKKFAENPPFITGKVLSAPVSLSSVTAMVNFDMIGRMKPEQKSLSISGTGSAVEGDSILKLYEDTTLFKLKLRQGAGGGSDHASFYNKKLPVFFMITGMHEDYHTPSDTWEKIDSAGMENVLRFAVKFINDIAGRDAKLTFKEAEQKQEGESRHGGGKTLGIVPDISDATGRGLRVEGVRKGGPADIGGIKKDDIIVSVNGQKISGIQDYMTSLGSLADKSKATVEVVRIENGMEKKYKLKIVL